MMSPKAVQAWLQSGGYRAQLLEEDEAAATIESGADGIPFRICFWRADPFDGDLDAFDDLSFFAAAETDEGDNFEKINKANSDNRYIKATLEGGSVYYSMDVAVASNDLSEKIFVQNFDAWIDWLPEMVQATVR